MTTLERNSFVNNVEYIKNLMTQAQADKARIVELEAERDSLQERVSSEWALAIERDAIIAQLDAALRVVEAARVWRNDYPEVNPDYDYEAEKRLGDALAAYDAARKQ